MTRSFIAAEITREIKNRLSELALELGGLGLPLKTTNPDSLHITLLFLGEADDVFLARAKTAMDEAAAAVTPFSILFRGSGGFPSDSRPSVIWAGIEDAAGGLAALRDGMADRLFPEEKNKPRKRFVPHVTLARAKKDVTRTGGDDLKRWIAGRQALEFGGMTVRGISLFESRLKRNGAVHIPLHRSPFSEP